MYTLKDILKIEVAPALGCTEPGAVALCASAARSLLKDEQIDSIHLTVDTGIYKNGLGVAIPGTSGEYGIELAAALGAIGGNPELKLEALRNIDDEIIKQAKKMLNQDKVKVNVDGKQKSIYVHAVILSGNDKAEAFIEDLHDNLTILRFNGDKIENHPLINEIEKKQDELSKLEDWLKERKLEELISLLDQTDDDDLTFLEQGLDYNLKLAKHGLTYGSGLGVGKTLERLAREGLLKRDMMLEARIIASAAADARMSGAMLPAMSSAGSGNHGLTAILPIWAVKDYLKDVDRIVILKAIALSHIITSYIKAFTGRLSAVCGCSVAAGAGAAAGITYLMGGNISHIAGAIKNLIEDLAGIICDGAKNACALKLSTAAGTAVQAALFSLHGIDVKERDGIVDLSPEQTMKNVGMISTDGMIETDRTILQIMINKKFISPE